MDPSVSDHKGFSKSSIQLRFQLAKAIQGNFEFLRVIIPMLNKDSLLILASKDSKDSKAKRNSWKLRRTNKLGDK